MPNLPQMLSVAEARDRILEHFSALGGEQVPLSQAAGRVLAEDVAAKHDLPPFANSSMDGYAVRVGETAGATPARPVRLPVSADIPAGGGLPAPLAPGSAARIMTGAPLPVGAEAVVPVEDTNDSPRARRRTAAACHRDSRRARAQREYAAGRAGHACRADRAAGRGGAQSVGGGAAGRAGRGPGAGLFSAAGGHLLHR